MGGVGVQARCAHGGGGREGLCARKCNTCSDRMSFWVAAREGGWWLGEVHSKIHKWNGAVTPCISTPSYLDQIGTCITLVLEMVLPDYPPPLPHPPA